MARVSFPGGAADEWGEHLGLERAYTIVRVHGMLVPNSAILAPHRPRNPGFACPRIPEYTGIGGLMTSLTGGMPHRARRRSDMAKLGVVVFALAAILAFLALFEFDQFIPGLADLGWSPIVWGGIAAVGLVAYFLLRRSPD